MPLDSFCILWFASWIGITYFKFHSLIKLHPSNVYLKFYSKNSSIFVTFQFGSNQASSKNDKTNPYNPRLPQNQFPILVFYPRDKKGVQYHGPLTVEAILEFLLSARNPIYHLRSKTDLLELQARHNGKVIVGYFPEIDSKSQLQGRKAFRYKL